MRAVQIARIDIKRGEYAVVVRKSNTHNIRYSTLKLAFEQLGISFKIETQFQSPYLISSSAVNPPPDGLG